MKISPTVKQSVYSLAAILNMMNLGLVIGFSAVLIPALTDPDNSDFVVNQNQASWLASLSGVSGLIPLLVMGLLMQIHGRKITNICVTIPPIIGWILTYASNSLTVLFISRVLQSLGSGCAYFFATCISEFSCPKIRGTLLNMKIIFISSGITLMHVTGYFFHWRYVALVATIPVSLALIITLLWPETPDWLVSQGKFEEAEKVFYSLRGKSEESKLELVTLIKYGKEQQEMHENMSISEQFKKLCSKTLWRPLTLLFCGITVPEFGGRIFFPSYSVELLTEITGDAAKGYIFTFVLDGVTIFSNIVSFYFVRKFGRRTLILYPTYGAIVVLDVTAAILFFRANYFDSKALMYTTVALLAFYFFIVTSTTFSVAYILMGELLPLEFRMQGSVISGLLSCVSSTVTTRIMPMMRSSLGVHGMLFTYSLCMLITVIYLHYDLPETKGRTLQDIAYYFKDKSPKVRRIEDCMK